MIATIKIKWLNLLCAHGAIHLIIYRNIDTCILFKMGVIMSKYSFQFLKLYAYFILISKINNLIPKIV